MCLSTQIPGQTAPDPATYFTLSPGPESGGCREDATFPKTHPPSGWYAYVLAGGKITPATFLARGCWALLSCYTVYGFNPAQPPNPGHPSRHDFALLVSSSSFLSHRVPLGQTASVTLVTRVIPGLYVTKAMPVTFVIQVPRSLRVTVALLHSTPGGSVMTLGATPYAISIVIRPS